MKNIRDKLKDANIRITELAFYLDISRPTLYNFLELYINDEHDKLEKKIYDLFTFIDNKKPLTNPILMNYLIANEISENVQVIENESELIRSIKKIQKSKSSNHLKKVKLIETIVLSNKIDFLIEELFEYINTTEPTSIEEFKKFLEKKEGERKNGWKIFGNQEFSQYWY